MWYQRCGAKGANDGDINPGCGNRNGCVWGYFDGDICITFNHEPTEHSTQYKGVRDDVYHEIFSLRIFCELEEVVYFERQKPSVQSVECFSQSWHCRKGEVTVRWNVKNMQLIIN